MFVNNMMTNGSVLMIDSLNDGWQKNKYHMLKDTNNGLVSDAQQHMLYFGVKFYAADPCKLHEEITRYSISAFGQI